MSIEVISKKFQTGCSFCSWELPWVKDSLLNRTYQNLRWELHLFFKHTIPNIRRSYGD